MVQARALLRERAFCSEGSELGACFEASVLGEERAGPFELNGKFVALLLLALAALEGELGGFNPVREVWWRG